MSTLPPTDRIRHDATLIIGAGPAGLAVAASLRRQGLPFTLLEQSGQVGDSWRRHYERLHLHTDKAHSALPFKPWPASAPRYPSRQQVVDYLQAYADEFEIRPRFHQAVQQACRLPDGSWAVTTTDAHYRAHHLVVATGINHEPHRPHWPGQDGFSGPIVHSADYRSGAAYAGQQVLVVGLGNSGGEIAIDLWEQGAKPALSVRSPVNVIPREVLGTPFLTVGILQQGLPAWLADALNAPATRLLVGDLRPYGLRRPALGPVAQIRQEGKVPFIDIGTIGLIKRGLVTVHPGIERFTRDGVIFTDGQNHRFDAVVLATGYRSRVGEWLEGAASFLPDKTVPGAQGQAQLPTGLHLCGFYVSPTGMLREIGLEAQEIAQAIARSPMARAAQA